MTNQEASFPVLPNVSNPAGFLDQLDSIRTEAQKSLNIERQSDLGQFFTQPSVAKLMAGMFSSYPSSINLVDPGAGVGTLSAAFIESAMLVSPKPEKYTFDRL